MIDSVQLLLLSRDAGSREEALASGIFPGDFLQDYLSTFQCVACTLVGSSLREASSAAFYPEVPRRRRAAHWTNVVNSS